MSWPGVGAHSIRRKLIGIVLATTFAALTLAGVALAMTGTTAARVAAEGAGATG